MTSGKMFFTAAIALIAVAASAKDGFREVITDDSFTMLNIIPSSPGREEVAAADAKEFAERTGNPEAERACPPLKGIKDRDDRQAVHRTQLRASRSTEINPTANGGNLV